MQNDHKGRIAHDICGHTLESFYASGQRGPEVRADGRGGSLARGYYAAHPCERASGSEDVPGGMVGPLNTRSAAVEAGIASLNEHVNGPRDLELTIVDRDGRIVGAPETFEDDSLISAQDLLRQAAHSAVTVGRVELRQGGELVACAYYDRGRGVVQTGTLVSE